MPRVPFAARVAAGIAATTVDEVRSLPSTVTGLPVTAVSKALQSAMRLQQHVTALAIRGDEVLSFLTPAEAEPSWATFDEDSEAATPGPRSVSSITRSGSANGSRAGGPGRFALYTQVPDDAEETRAAPTLAESGSAPVPGYATMTLAQLRARLRSLSLTELEELLGYEQSHRNRAPFVTMLGNRVDTVRDQ
ncbi:lipid droplet-associated protein [Rhodococcus aerolatus]